jgi:hypothetical protein
MTINISVFREMEGATVRVQYIIDKRISLIVIYFCDRCFLKVEIIVVIHGSN